MASPALRLVPCCQLASSPSLHRRQPSPRQLPAAAPPAARPAWCDFRRSSHASPCVVRAVSGGGEAGGPATFLSLEEAGLVEMAGLDMHERFLARLTISSLNLLRVISEQEGVPIEELNAGRVCDWFLKDKARREQDVESAVLKWPKAPEW